MTDAIERPTTPQIRLGDMITASWMTQAIYAAVSLGIPDLLKQGPRPSRASGATMQRSAGPSATSDARTLQLGALRGKQ
jgi:hypothetical protein